MKILEDAAIWSLLRPRVTHRLPGRLRLRVPLLRKLPDEWLQTAQILEQVMCSPDGIRSVRSSRTTGSILVEYDPDMLSEADVLGFIRTLLELLWRHRDRFAGLNNGQAAKFAARLEEWVHENTRFHPVIDSSTDIPDELWT